MHWLEARFRRQFEPHGEEFLFRQSDREVIFDREDVELFVADFRRYWFSPWLWSAFLLLGITPLVVMRLWAIESYEAFFVVVPAVTLISCPVALWVAWRGPYEAAFKHPSVGPGAGRSEITREIWMIVIAAMWLGILKPGYSWEDLPFVVWGVALVVAVVRLIWALWKRWRLAPRTVQ